MLPIASGGTNATSAAAALTNLGAAPSASPALTGTPTAPSAAAATDNTQIATTLYADRGTWLFQPQQQTGRYYAPPGSQGLFTPATTTSTTYNFVGAPIYLGKSKTLESLACEVTTYGGTSFNVQMVVYADSGGYPAGAPLAYTASTAVSTSGAQVAAVTAPVTLAPGIYWPMVAYSYLASGTSAFRAINNGNYGISNVTGWSLTQGSASAAYEGTNFTVTATTFTTPPTLSTIPNFNTGSVMLVWMGF